MVAMPATNRDESLAPTGGVGEEAEPLSKSLDSIFGCVRQAKFLLYEAEFCKGLESNNFGEETRDGVANRWPRRLPGRATRELPLLKTPERSILSSQRTGIR
jgi:hypothetical protein